MSGNEEDRASEEVYSDLEIGGSNLFLFVDVVAAGLGVSSVIASSSSSSSSVS
jgi:hypothetical protein